MLGKGAVNAMEETGKAEFGLDVIIRRLSSDRSNKSNFRQTQLKARIGK